MRPEVFCIVSGGGKTDEKRHFATVFPNPQIPNERVSYVENANTNVRLRNIERELEDVFPGVWKRAEKKREKLAKNLPAWCYLPFDVWIKAACESIRPGGVDKRTLSNFAGAVSTIGTWRITRGIYRFDPDLMSEIIDTPVEGEIPCEVLRRLPEWCVYVETPGFECDGENIHGFFAHLEKEENSDNEELVMLINTEKGCSLEIVHLGDYSLDDGIRIALEKYGSYIPGGLSGEARAALMRRSGRRLEPLLSLLLYLCSANADIGNDARKPRIPKPVRASNGKKKILAAGNTRIWDVGERVGAAIRRGREAARFSGGGATAGGGGSKRPHVRRAHWHGYWYGPREGDRVFKFVWIPPTHVKIDASAAAENLPAVGHAVEEESRSA